MIEFSVETPLDFEKALGNLKNNKKNVYYQILERFRNSNVLPII
jgi:hypothetical protein